MSIVDSNGIKLPDLAYLRGFKSICIDKYGSHLFLCGGIEGFGKVKNDKDDKQIM